ncbi:hypothetical protein [Qipengyuania sp.]|uniref:hypothetical protein n=1 Tax=Qipengyuania sp. TaxID=2004515 RepID=UPI0035C87553
MSKLVVFVLLCLLSLGCAVLLASWGPHSTIREMYVVDSFENPFLLILYAPFAFAIYTVLSWWRASSRKTK